MAYVVIARWKVKPGREQVVLDALRTIIPLARAEPAMRLYEPCLDPERPGELTIVEIYDDEAGYQAHIESEHMQRYGFGVAIPELDSRTRETFHTLD
jgi:quinol monooxygenase YgiN